MEQQSPEYSRRATKVKMASKNKWKVIESHVILEIATEISKCNKCCIFNGCYAVRSFSKDWVDHSMILSTISANLKVKNRLKSSSGEYFSVQGILANCYPLYQRPTSGGTDGKVAEACSLSPTGKREFPGTAQTWTCLLCLWRWSSLLHSSDLGNLDAEMGWRAGLEAACCWVRISLLSQSLPETKTCLCFPLTRWGSGSKWVIYKNCLW